MDRMPVYAAAILIIGTIAWFVPFVLVGWSRSVPQERDPRWVWGLFLQVLGYGVACVGGVKAPPAATWRVALSAAFLALANLLSWTGARTLGRHLRFDAALDVDHRLVRSGPYRMLRHPIYASMLCLLLGVALATATLPCFALALALFVTGTEIRVRLEDKLLAERFGEEFEAYRRGTPAYIPLLR